MQFCTPKSFCSFVAYHSKSILHNTFPETVLRARLPLQLCYFDTLGIIAQLFVEIDSCSFLLFTPYFLAIRRIRIGAKWSLVTDTDIPDPDNKPRPRLSVAKVKAVLQAYVLSQRYFFGCILPVHLWLSCLFSQICIEKLLKKSVFCFPDLVLPTAQCMFNFHTPQMHRMHIAYT